MSRYARKSGFQPDSADEHLARRVANQPPDRTETNSTDIVDFGFRGLDPQQPIVQKHGHLPHWEQSGATYFVTFRLADSLPANVLASVERRTHCLVETSPAALGLEDRA